MILEPVDRDIEQQVFDPQVDVKKRSVFLDTVGDVANQYMKRTIIEIVETQLEDNDPPETTQTLHRLLAAGYSRKKAVEMIGSVVAVEIWEMLHQGKEHDPERFRAALAKLG